MSHKFIEAFLILLVATTFTRANSCLIGNNRDWSAAGEATLSARKENPWNLWPAWAVALLLPLNPNSWEGYATKGTNRHVMLPFLANDTGEQECRGGWGGFWESESTVRLEPLAWLWNDRELCRHNGFHLSPATLCNIRATALETRQETS